MKPSSEIIFIKEKGGWRPLADGEAIPFEAGQEFAVGAEFDSASLYQLREDENHQIYIFGTEPPAGHVPREEKAPERVSSPPVREKTAGPLPSLTVSDQAIPNSLREIEFYLGAGVEGALSEAGKARVNIEDLFYDDNPKLAFRLIRDEKGNLFMKALHKNQEIPVLVTRPREEGPDQVILQVGSSTSNLFEEEESPALEGGDEMTVGMINQFVMSWSETGGWNLRPKDPSLALKVTLPH